MSGVKVIVRNAGGDLVQLANFIDRRGWEVKQNAEEGSVGISTLYMDDLDESIYDTLGFTDGARRAIRLVDYDSNKIVHYGYTARRTIKRRYDIYGSPIGRAWGIEIWDPNAILQRRILTHNGAKRPRETDVDRINWLVGTPEWDLVTQFMIAASPTSTMSKADMRGQTVGDVLADCAQQSGKNYWIDLVDLQEGEGEELTLWYGRDNREVYYSTLSISNDMADLDLEALSEGTATMVYPPANDTEYSMDPTRVFSGIYGTWEKGAVYRHRNTTGTAFERWDTAMQWPNIHEKDRAIDRAERMLDRLDEEDERIETAILVPSTQAHLIRAGMRIPLKLTHVPRLVDFTDCRVLGRGLSPAADGTRYLIPLTLEPIGPADPVPECGGLVQITAAATDGGGVTTTWDSEPTPGNRSISLMARRAISDTGEPVAIDPDTMDPVAGTDYTMLVNEAGPEQSIQAAWRLLDADDTKLVSWQTLEGSASPIAITAEIEGNDDPVVFSNNGFNALTMGIDDVVCASSGILIIGFQIINFDIPPAILTPPSGAVLLIDDDRTSNNDFIQMGYIEIPEAVTFDLTWTASNIYNWWFEAVAVFVPADLCDD